MGERPPCTRKVAGSSPAISTFLTPFPKMESKSLPSLVEIMDEKEIKKFLKELEVLCRDFFSLIQRLKNSEINREICFFLQKKSEEIEVFLDDYGAINNKRFFYFRELIASVRWINIALFQSLHIIGRFRNYELDFPEEYKASFLQEVRKNCEFYLSCLRKLGEELIKEGEKIGIKSKIRRKIQLDSLEIIPKKILPPDLDEKVLKSKKGRVVEILMKFLEILEKFTIYVCDLKSNQEITEEDLETFRSSFNRLQSLYDSYLKNTDIERKIEDLKKIRGHISVTLHLLEIGKALAHFYERHTTKIRKYSTAIKISLLINPSKIKSNLKKFVIPNAFNFAQRGKKVSERIFKLLKTDPDEYIIETKPLIIPSHRIEDFHIRPIIPVTQVANKYKAETFLYFNRKRYNMKSAIEMAIAIPDIREFLKKENTRIILQGPKKAVEEISSFLYDKCGAYKDEKIYEIA